MITARRGQQFILVGLALCLAWLVLIRGYADYLARPLPSRSAALNAAQPEALLRLGEAALIKGQIDDAKAYAQRAIYSQPLEGRALRLLAAATEAAGDRAAALAMMRVAAKRAPRDTAAQFWLALNALADKNLPDALQRIDRLLRFEPELADDVFPLLATIAINPVGAPVIAASLATRPPWRQAFMERLIRESPSTADLGRLFRAIERAGDQATELELDRFASRLLHSREWPRLRKLVAQMSGSAAPALLHDGAFDGVNPGTLRGWTIDRVAGADVLISAQGAGNRVLRVVFHDRRVPFSHVRQSLLLEPGRYQLRGQVRLLNLRAAQGLTWTLACSDGRTNLGQSELFRGDSDWRPFSFNFTIDNPSCGAQILRLTLIARIAAEQQVVGEAWFDDFSVEVTDTAQAEPAPVAAIDTKA